MKKTFKQWQYDGKELTLFVQPSPLAIRITLFTFAFLPPAIVLTIMIWTIAEKSFSPGILIGLAAAVFISSRLIRMALWNSVGKERLSFWGNTVGYQPDYGWMKGDLKETMIEPLTFTVWIDDYAEDGFGQLRIGPETSGITCVTKLRIEELDTLLKELQNDHFVTWESATNELL